MILNDRMIIGDNTVLVDASKEFNDYKSETVVHPFVVAEDYLYIASDFPFNHKYFDMSVVNSASTTISEVALWDGVTWTAAVDVLDYTDGLGQSGYVRWTKDKNESWMRSDTVDANDTEEITDLGDVTIYDLYWVRIKFAGADMSAGTAINFIGNRFSDQDDLETEYPTLNTSNAKTQFQSGKTTWDEQEFHAASLIIKDLKRAKVILSPNQILDWSYFTTASVHKVAEIIFKEFGDDWNDQRQVSRDYYKEAMKMLMEVIDQNQNTVQDLSEKTGSVGFLHR